VADDGRQRYAPVHRAVLDVQVRPADPDERHVESHPARARRLGLALLDADGPVTDVRGRAPHAPFRQAIASEAGLPPDVHAVPWGNENFSMDARRIRAPAPGSVGAT
jgi:hypothetical protein